MFNRVNDKQTTDGLKMIEKFHQRINSRIRRTIHQVYISSQISRRVYLGLSPSTTAHKESVFSIKLFKGLQTNVFPPCAN